MSESPVTTSLFIATALGIARCEPPPARRGSRYGRCAHCWLCSGATGGEGWPRETLLAPTFTQHNMARRIDSDAICQPCAAVISGDVFKELIASRRLPVKTWTQCGWHSYSHYVHESGDYAVPDREMARAILSSPPAGRWVMALNPTGQQHTLIRAAVASSRHRFPVQLGDETVWVTQADFVACLSAFEALSELGFSKDDTLRGEYHPESMRRAGLARWRPAEEAARPWRDGDPALFALVHNVSRSAKFYGPPEPSPQQKSLSGRPAQMPKTGQMEMF